MKKINMMMTLMMCLMTMVSYGQEVTYEQVKNGSADKGKYHSYVSNSGETFKVGDKIEIGYPTGANGNFVTIQAMSVINGQLFPVGSQAINTTSEIKKINVGGMKKQGIYALFRTKGIASVYIIKIEDAIDLGEVKTSGMTSDQALSELKKAKDKLDLEIITEDEYEDIKSELLNYIK